MNARSALVLAALAVAAPLAGCTRADTVNPNLQAPKLLLDVRLDGSAIAFVHAAFGDRIYDRLELVVNNQSLRSSSFVYSMEEPLNASTMYLEARARAGEIRWLFRGTIEIEPVKDRVRVAIEDENGDWTTPREFGLPFERILDRQGGSP